ncbi:MAG: thioredoxin domain-containing protein [Pirellulales bacterium]
MRISPAPLRQAALLATLLAALLGPLPCELTVRGAEEQPAHTNRLATETSPYLKLHAHNPVNWYPWGEEALAKAERENKLIFLSVGYSSCYWCHVMERESFMDEEIAAFLNEHFVCIKVDREERPDLDTIYMTAVQILTRRGGWPMSVFLTPQRKPFFGGTYFPARDGDRGTSTGFLTIIRKVQQIWAEQPDQVTKSADQLTDFVRQQIHSPPESKFAWDNGLPAEVMKGLGTTFDPKYGGFGFEEQSLQVPKFPEPSNLGFLLHRVTHDQDTTARDMLLLTLDQIVAGGIHDHVGGGFHRYSTDRRWEIPHFEKMLYDNAQLVGLLAEASTLADKPAYAAAARDTAEFVLREMTSPDGAFYSALDAESEQVEGKYYRWTREELEKVLGDDYPLMATIFDTNQPPNFEQEYYVLRLTRPLADIARDAQLTPEELNKRLDGMRAKLMAYRNQRIRPLLDDKVLTGWNGQMIRGLADAGRFLKEPRYVDAAARAADFLLNKLTDTDGRLLHTYSDGQAKLKAYVDDYALLIDGLIALHQATNDPKWLDAADKLQQQQNAHYWDQSATGYFFTADDHEELIVRIKQFVDNVQPSGNSVAIGNLRVLAEAKNHPEYLELARGVAQAASDLLTESPAALPRMVLELEKLPQ